MSLKVQLKGTQPLITYRELKEERKEQKECKEWIKGVDDIEYKQKEYNKNYSYLLPFPTRLITYAYNHECEP
jgi:hypothetical protein